MTSFHHVSPPEPDKNVGIGGGYAVRVCSLFRFCSARNQSSSGDPIGQPISRLFSIMEMLFLHVHTSAAALVRSGTSFAGLQFSFCSQPVLFRRSVRASSVQPELVGECGNLLCLSMPVVVDPSRCIWCLRAWIDC